MNGMCFRFGIAGVALEICGPTLLIQPLQAAWARWEPSPDVVPWRVTISPDAKLLPPDVPLFAAIPMTRAGTCTLTTTGFRGTVKAPDATAHLRVHRDATPADVGYFARVVLATSLPLT